MDTRTLFLRCAALLTAGAALIHVGVAGDHFHEWWAAGLFFLIVAAAQLGWSLWCWLRPASRRLLLIGVGGSLALVLLWAVSRTTGLPIGPEAGTPEAVGAADLVCAGLEVASAALAAALAVPRLGERLARPAPRRAAALTIGVAAAVVAASGAAIAAPSPDHAEAAAGGHVHASGDAAQTTPGAHDHHDVPNLPDTSKATPEQTAAATSLLDRTIAATVAYRDPAAAIKAGFDVQAAWDRKQNLLAKAGTAAKAGKAGGARASLVHVPHRANRTDGRILDPSAPETLIYSHSADGTFRLVGVMFTAERKAPPTTYQPYVRWHTHTFCTGGGAAKLKPVNGACPSGTTARTSGAMTHLWFVANTNLVQAYAVKPPVAALLAYQKSLA
jgi:hypothetical protein